MRLQNIRFPEPDICREEELYFHRNGEWIDFNGYFNLFYIEKRKKYTNQETLTLHLEVGDCQAVSCLGGMRENARRKSRFASRRLSVHLNANRMCCEI